mmetsp:Transcript_11616/g.34600  ORF Transcript_11616/g.34600 Transcript_11616/m.34600 type:complete len:232 (+) Transcript_11616:56-751(+)
MSDGEPSTTSPSRLRMQLICCVMNWQTRMGAWPSATWIAMISIFSQSVILASSYFRPSSLRSRISCESREKRPSLRKGLRVRESPLTKALTKVGASSSDTPSRHRSSEKPGSRRRNSRVAAAVSVSAVMASTTLDAWYTSGFCDVSQNSRASSSLSLTRSRPAAAARPAAVSASVARALPAPRRMSEMMGASLSRSRSLAHVSSSSTTINCLCFSSTSAAASASLRCSSSL